MFFKNNPKTIKFHKMHGLGNDFVIVFENKKYFSPEQIIMLSHRKYGIGCDQFVIVKKLDNNQAHIFFYNNDGSYASACGNGTRCIAWLLHNKFGYQEDLTLLVDQEVIKASCYENEVTLELRHHSFTVPQEISDRLVFFNKLNHEYGLPDHIYVYIGNSHLIYFVSDILLYEIEDIGRKIQHILPDGINVTIATIATPNQLIIRTYERGAGLTEACGSAAAACGAYYLTALTSQHIAQHSVKIQMIGGDLTIGITVDDTITMRGKTAYVYSGEISF